MALAGGLEQALQAAERRYWSTGRGKHSQRTAVRWRPYQRCGSLPYWAGEHSRASW
jgi:hypothetical protein